MNSRLLKGFFIFCFFLHLSYLFAPSIPPMNYLALCLVFRFLLVLSTLFVPLAAAASLLVWEWIKWAPNFIYHTKSNDWTASQSLSLPAFARRLSSVTHGGGPPWWLAGWLVGQEGEYDRMSFDGAAMINGCNWYNRAEWVIYKLDRSIITPITGAA